MAQDGIGAVVRPLQGWDDTAVVHPTRGARRRSPGSSSGSWWPELCLLDRENTRASRILKKISEILSMENSFACKNSLGKTRGVPKIASARERPVSSLGWEQSPRMTQGISSAQVAVAHRGKLLNRDGTRSITPRILGRFY